MGIYDICDLEITRRDLVKHRREQKKIVVANETNLNRALSRQQFFKMDSGINSAETTAENDDSFLAQPTSYPSDHRILSIAELPERSRREPVDDARTTAQTVARFLCPVIWTA